MTISSQARTAGPFACNGSTTVFPFAFKVFSTSDVTVVFRTDVTGVEATLVLGVDYTVSLNTNQDANPGGTVTTIGAFSSGTTLTLTSKVAYLQPTDLTNQGGFYPKVITTALDRLTIFTQQLLGLANRALKFPISDGNLDGTLPGKDQRKGRLLAFHETTGLPVAGPTISDTATVGDNITAIKTVADNIADVNTVAEYADEVANFNATYQGPKGTDPTTRNDGTALQQGDLYFNTNSKRLRVYTGSRWSEANTGSVSVQTFTGNGATTSFQLNTAPDSENVVQVFVGGVYQSKTVYDLTGVNGDMLTFVSAPPNGVSIEAVTFSVLPLGVVDASQVRMTGGRTLDEKFGEFKSIKDFGAVGDGSANDTVTIKNAISSMSVFGGTLYVPPGIYKVTETIYLPSGVTLQGAGSFQATASIRYGASTLFCSHTGAAMVSLKGANGCSLRDIALVGDQLAKPKTGLCLGRSTSASAGHHQIDNVSITGWFTVAAIYSIASEENEMRKVFTWNFGGDAPYGLVSSTQDIFGVDSLVTSTNIHNTYSNVIMYVTSSLSSAAGIFLQTSNDMGNIAFNNCYIIPYAGVYVRISNGALGDGKAAFGPITFNGTSGEIFSGGNPKMGIYVTASVPVTLAGLSVVGCRFQLPANAGGDVYDILVDDNVTLTNPHIVIQPPEAFPYAESKVRADKVKGGIVSVGRRNEWTNASLLNSWANELGAPYPAASYNVSPTGEVALRGVISNGSGVMFTLPDGIRPANSLIFSTTSSTGIGRILVTSAGNVSLLSGATSAVDLSPVRFRVS